MGVKDYYERQYGDESQVKLRLPFLYRKLRRFELNRNDLACQLALGGDSLLDIGCGDGELLLLLKDKYRQLYGIDIAKPRIDRIRKKCSNESNIHVILGDINRQLPFADGSFDTITVISVLEHIFDPYHLMKECYRLLREKGTLIVQVPNIAWFPYRIRALMGKVPEAPGAEGGEWDYEHLHYFTRTSLKKLFEREGFRVERITSGGIFAKPRRIWGSLLSGDIFMVGTKVGG
jgi:methionine biosynthesis protein MetW